MHLLPKVFTGELWSGEAHQPRQIGGLRPAGKGARAPRSTSPTDYASQQALPYREVIALLKVTAIVSDGLIDLPTISSSSAR